ncbi:hypothetical protein [Spongiivirga citrea]|uniref:Uncharacterized protein n=1 Tax=Spongiivirga citrea TaxID=1481457 RepID=A0A6M0CHJ4_9FLAO|nr:hypothetical protein [Spongiivirga citrea]NER17418.1 hypothetical protein [Spongiivirga citrea]
MKRTISILICLLVSTIIYGQDVKMTTEYSTENQELSDLLYFEKIDFYKVQFIGKEITRKDYVLICKEMWDGAVRRIDTIVNTSNFKKIPKTTSDTLNLKVYAKRTDESKLKLWFRFPNFGFERKYEATQSDDYSLRDVGVSESIAYGKNFYAFAYILPYEKGDFKYWCAVDTSGKDVANWGKEFGIKHYLIFEMMFQ